MRALPVAIAAVLLLAGCVPVPPDATAAPTSAPPTDAPPSTAPPPAETDLPPGFDEQPDGEAPTADDELSTEELSALLRLPATGVAATDTCQPSQVTVRLLGMDVASGHRYSSIEVTNASDAPCMLSGYPGIGGRGEWGSALLFPVEQATSADGEPAGPVTLEPGAAASASLEWTGALAGAVDEHCSLLVLQLAAGQDPLPLGTDIHTTADADMGSQPETIAGPLDIGMFTTVRVGALALAD